LSTAVASDASDRCLTGLIFPSYYGFFCRVFHKQTFGICGTGFCRLNALAVA